MKGCFAVPLVEQLPEALGLIEFVRSARVAIRSIRESADKGDEMKKLREEVDKLTDENRGLRDRPGALRLVGVGLSGLSDYRQLTLDEPGLAVGAE